MVACWVMPESSWLLIQDIRRGNVFEECLHQQRVIAEITRIDS
jgi:hypothetical protein